MTFSPLDYAAFIGFYNPAWAGPAQLNPYTHAVSILGHIDTLTPMHVLRPIAILLVVHAAVAAIGALAARRVEP